MNLNHEKEEKLGRLKKAGVELYPARCTRTHKSNEIATLAAGLQSGERLSQQKTVVAGRLTQIRLMGKTCFINIKDDSGKIQAYLRRDELGELFDLFCETVETGDLISVAGYPFKTKTGEPSVHAGSWTMLAKALRPPPEKWHGLKDVELRYRQRYLDLMANNDIAQIFIKRAAIISGLRQVLDNAGFIETETPVFQPQAGGAAARPFITRHEALDCSLFLRIATELHLKRLLVGGMERVYEIGKCFRNEGIDTTHNPEFTMLEAYQAYADYEDMAALTEKLTKAAAGAAGAKTELLRFEKAYLPQLWQEHAGEPLNAFLNDPYHFNREKLIDSAQILGVRFDPKSPSSKIFDKIMDQKILPRLPLLCFVFDYPTAVSPLAKNKPQTPELVERFELFKNGTEIANAFSELNDPMEQRRRMQAQVQLREEEKDEEAPPLDEDFLTALEHGMPPAGGLGIGIDRLCMALLEIDSIREIILFPALKSLKE